MLLLVLNKVSFRRVSRQQQDKFRNKLFPTFLAAFFAAFFAAFLPLFMADFFAVAVF